MGILKGSLAQRLLLTAMLSLGAFAAHAGTVVQCVGTASTTFSPPITNTAQNTTVSISEVQQTCLHIPIIGLPFLMSAQNNVQVQRTLSCQSLLNGGTGVSVLHWANGDTSTINWQSSVNTVSGSFVVVRTGTIASGRYAGQSTSETLIQTPLLAGNPDFLTACGADGVPAIEGSYTLDIL